MLPQLQPDIIKIDRELIDHVDQDKYKQAIVSKLIDLAKQLDIDVVAEGIERQGELDFLTNHGVDYVQGYLLGRPEALPLSPARNQYSLPYPVSDCQSGFASWWVLQKPDQNCFSFCRRI